MSISNRVRLYELSRELDLDTKDVMAVCEQLNIIVKSHSSTITESEAELVRVKAPQYHPKTADPRISDKKSVTTKTKELEVRTAKPQILAVTKPTVRLNNSPASGNVGAIPPLSRLMRSLSLALKILQKLLLLTLCHPCPLLHH